MSYSGNNALWVSQLCTAFAGS